MGVKFIGRRLGVGIGKETTRGVGVSPSYWLNCLSFSHRDKVNKARTLGTFGNITGGDKALVSQKWAEGGMEVEIGDKSFGLLLLALLGTVSSAVKETTAYKHTFTLQDDNQHDSLSIHTTDPIGDLIFELSMIDSMTIKFIPDQLVNCSVEFKSKNSAGNVVTKAYVSENKFLGRHLSLKIAATTATLTAAAKIKPKEVEITFKKNLEIDNALGTVQPQDILNRLFTIEGKIKLNFEDLTYANYMLDGSYKALRLDLENTDVTIGASSNPSFRIDLSKVDFDAWEQDYSLDDIAKQSIQFQALYDLGGNANLINNAYLINEVSSY